MKAFSLAVTFFPIKQLNPNPKHKEAMKKKQVHQNRNYFRAIFVHKGPHTHPHTHTNHASSLAKFGHSPLVFLSASGGDATSHDSPDGDPATRTQHNQRELGHRLPQITLASSWLRSARRDRRNGDATGIQ